MQFSVSFKNSPQTCHSRIGFNDTALMVVMTPLLAFIIPLVFFGVRFNKPVYYTPQIYLHTFLTTLAVWLGNRWIMIWARNRYPHFTDVRKRLGVQSASMGLYTVIVTNVLSIALKDVCDISSVVESNKTLGEILFTANATSLFCSLTIAAIYESRYFMNELKRSVEEKETLKRESLNAQLDALRTQINPHFLFNNLNTLTAIIPEEPEKAVRFVQQLSKVYRHILEVKDEPAIPLQDELSVLNSYAFLLQTRFGKNLHIKVNIPDELLTQKVAPLSLQLLLENAIKHNVVSEEHPLFIHVYADKDKLVVRNNLQLKRSTGESVGLGLQNIRQRSHMLTNKLVEVVNGPENFIVSIPLISL